MAGNLQLLDRPAPGSCGEEPLDLEVLFKEARRRQRRRRAFATVGAAAAGLAIAASLLSVVGRGAATRRPEGTQAPTRPTPTAVPAGPFAGYWSLHESSLTIKPDGHGAIVYPFYVRCGSGPFESPVHCDVWKGNESWPGGHAEIILTNVGKTTAMGRITGSDDQAVVPDVNVALRLGSVYGVQLLYASSTGPRPLCSFLTVPLCSPAARLYFWSHNLQTAPLLNCGA